MVATAPVPSSTKTTTSSNSKSTAHAKEIETLQERVKELEALVRELRAGSKAAERDTGEKDRLIASLHTDVKARDARLKEMEATTRESDRKIKELEKSAVAQKDKAGQIAQAQADGKAKELRIKELETRVREHDKVVATLKDQARASEREQSAAETKRRKESDKGAELAAARAKEIADHLAAAQHDLHARTASLEQAVDTNRALQEQVHQMQTQAKEGAKELAHLRAQLASDQALSQQVQQLQTATQEQARRYEALDTSYREEQRMRKRYWNEMSDMKGRIRVYCRVRPLTKEERTTGGPASRMVTSYPDIFTLQLELPSRASSPSFVFDGVYPPETSQEQVWDDTQSVVQSAVDGYNACIFAYGQTSAGKTHTMTGTQADPGLTPRAVSLLFKILAANAKAFRYKVSCYMVELYNDNLVDLLREDTSSRQAPPPLQIKRTPQGVVYLDGVSLVPLASHADFPALFQRALKSRHTSATLMNASSSRSHMVFTLLIEQVDLQNGAALTSKLSFIDLAGSERVARSGATADRLKEAQSINLSLSALGDVISALSKGEAFVPYRNHKLTQLMSDSLGGNSKTLMFVCVSPAQINADESNSSLAFASRVKSVTNNPIKMADSKEVVRLKAIIARMRTGERGVADDEVLVAAPEEAASQEVHSPPGPDRDGWDQGRTEGREGEQEQEEEDKDMNGNGHDSDQSDSSSSSLSLSPLSSPSPSPPPSYAPLSHADRTPIPR
eukprot:TRINITY_DN7008_c0_g1_i4.p1 TRINITY_DN7008_c0_g1~~TRINITY_DN7008_c0_g1_i4.p1  ORF type:complete len:799 (+),score=286.11 TRINITY_DN7008_c0_g1_i4:198-2399(+)